MTLEAVVFTRRLIIIIRSIGAEGSGPAGATRGQAGRRCLSRSDGQQRSASPIFHGTPLFNCIDNSRRRRFFVRPPFGTPERI
jgi:hypothetical protein